jgi:ABC-type cobalamin/Fe3+-siderophores transport system ATPase subunit
MHKEDDGHSGDVSVKVKSIPHLPTARLERRAAVLHHMTQTPEGLHAFDDVRRELVHHSIRLLAITHELKLRKAMPCS